MSNQKKCTAFDSVDLINAMGEKLPRPLRYLDVVKLLNSSDNIMYNGGDSMMGKQHTIAVDVANSGSWVRFNVAREDYSKVEELVQYLDCR